MKNEGWGIKEDQIPSSSHLLHQTMGSQLHILLNAVALNLQKIFGLSLCYFFDTLAYFFFVRFRWTFHLYIILRVSIFNIA